MARAERRRVLAEPFAEATGSQEAIASIAAVVLGAAGIYAAHQFYVAKAWSVPRAWALLEHKFYWAELYDLACYRPADLVSRGLGRFFEQPVVAGSIGELTRSVRFGAGEVSRVQNGLVRVYALALTSGVAVLAVVFLVTR